MVTIALHYRISGPTFASAWETETFQVTERTYRSARMFGICMNRARKGLMVTLDAGVECEWHQTPETPYRRCDICGGHR